MLWNKILIVYSIKKIRKKRNHIKFEYIKLNYFKFGVKFSH